MSETVDVTLGRFGNSYQEKVVQAIMCDHMFAEQMADVIRPEYFELKYLETVVRHIYKYKSKYRTYPSPDLIKIMVGQDIDVDSPTDKIVYDSVVRFIDNVTETPLNGDKSFIEESSLDFCRRQTLKEALVQIIDKVETSKYDECQTILKEALRKGSSHDLGQDYGDTIALRATCAERKPMSTGWPVIDRALNGGWERKTLVTFIAPTGAGKSMFLVNCSAAAATQGYNVIYITCEMADYKIGIRHDSYFSGVKINDIPNKTSEVENVVKQKLKGKLYIKEYPTKVATVQTIRSYIQRLQATKEFTPDVIVVDYADLLRGARSYGEKRHELEGVYEELRALSQEFNAVVITADQTNRGGLEEEIVSLSSIAESYAKATVCDVIMTVSRRTEDRQSNSGRLFIAKSRLGGDGLVYPFLMDTATVKATVLEQGQDPIATFLENSKNLAEKTAERYNKFKSTTA